jgi:hypothetical protein
MVTTEKEETHDKTCWICLNDDLETCKCCNCPHYVHPLCLVKWQITNLNKPEEKHCRFCSKMYPVWTYVIYHELYKLTNEPIYFRMFVDKKLYKIPVVFEQYLSFVRKLRDISGLAPTSDFTVNYTCVSPLSNTIIIIKSNNKDPHAFNMAFALELYNIVCKKDYITIWEIFEKKNKIILYNPNHYKPNKFRKIFDRIARLCF